MTPLSIFLVRIDNTTYNLLNEVDMNTIRLGGRADMSFEVGSCKIITSQIQANIPPYSIALIGLNYYIISSEAHKYLNTTKWIHDCKLMSLEAGLECFILGTKTYSHSLTGSDKNVMDYTITLINQKYGTNISNNSGSLLNNYDNDYNFPDGTTLFEVVKTIAKRNNLSYFCDFGALDILTQNWNISRLRINFRVRTNPTLSIENTTISNFVLFQNTENYCRFLETEATDVVDRNSIQEVMLTPRSSNGIALNEDTAELLLPTRCEAITGFYIKGDAHLSLDFTSPAITPALADQYSIDGYPIPKTLQQWINENIMYNGYNVFEQIKNLIFSSSDINMLSNSYSILLNNTNFAIFRNGDVAYFRIEDYDHPNNQDFDDSVVNFISAILEKNVWQSLLPSEQPKYVVYDTGTNRIYNMNGTYKNDLWSNILGITVNPFIQEQTRQFQETNSNISCTMHGTIGAGHLNATLSIFDFIYIVDYTPIFDPILIDEKDADTLSNLMNEATLKPVGRSYQMGNNNGLITDFKGLYHDMDEQNETLGLIEASLEIKISALNEVDIAANKKATFTLDNTDYEFYIISYEKRYVNEVVVATLNLARTPYKVADDIGVDYQFNSTYLPLDNIIQRPIYIDSNQRDDIALQGCLYLIFDFGRGGTTKTVVMKPTIVKTEYDRYYLYVEMMDNIVADMSVHDESGTNVYSLNNLSYVDNDGCADSLNIRSWCPDSATLKANGLPKDRLKLLPEINALTGITQDALYSQQLWSGYIYKDSREKLVFMIALKPLPTPSEDEEEHSLFQD